MSSILTINGPARLTLLVTNRVGPSLANVWYVADGTEGNSIVLDGSLQLNVYGTMVPLDLTLKTVVAVNRENYELMPTNDIPNNKQFNWAGETPTLTFGITNDLEEGEQIKITYR